MLNGYVFDSKSKVWIRKSGSQPFSYSDGDSTEIRLYNSLKDCRDVSLFSSDIQRHCLDWPSRYHFASVRANIVRPFAERIRKGKTLELGAGCGGVTRFLGELGGKVMAVDGSLRRASINASRCRDLTNVAVVVDKIQEFKTSERFDVVTLIGVLEYSQVYVGGENAIDQVLKIAYSFLKDDGVLLVAIENQLGLKYFCGAPEDHVGRPMFGINDSYSNQSVVTFGRKEVTKQIQRAGFKKTEVYTPFPDYKFPLTIIYPDGLNNEDPEWNLGTLLTNTVAFEPQPFKNPAFSLESAWQVIARNGLTADLANSFLIAAYPEKTSTDNNGILAAHYSGPGGRGQSLREHQFVVDGISIKVNTRPIIPTAELHEQQWVSRDYEAGIKSYDELVRLVNRPGWDLDEMIAWLAPWFNLLRCAAFELTDRPNEFSSYAQFLPGIYYDAMPTNLIIRKDGTAVLIDFEWEYPSPIPLEFVLHRGLYLSLRRLTGCAKPAQNVPLKLSALIETLLKAYDISFINNDYTTYLNFFRSFQNKIAGYPENYDNPLVKSLDYALLPVNGENKPEQYKVETEINNDYKDSKLSYELWIKKHGFNEINNNLLQRQLERYTTLQKFNMVMFVLPGEESYLADTLESVSHQIYPDWKLSIISVLPMPDPMFNELDNLEWVAIDQSIPPFQQLNDLLFENGSDWICLLDPGVQFQAHCLLAITNYINLNPDWSFVYADEDKLDSTGKRTAPQFKPDFNLELLRSMPYIGRVCFVKNKSLQAIGGFNNYSGSEVYDLAFRFFDQYNEKVIGHIADILIHMPSNPVRRYNEVAVLKVIEAHLKRIDTSANIMGGELDGTYYLDYQLYENPKVAIILLLNNNWKRVKKCVETILEKTDYKNYKLILLIDKANNQEVVEEIDRINYKNISIVDIPDKCLTDASLLNYGVEIADAEYVVFLNSHPLIIQNNWLTRLLSLGQTINTGIVGGRVVDINHKMKHAGIGLGMGSLGVGDYLQAGLALTDPGYMGRALVTQNASAVSSDCMLINKTLFQSVGGFDEAVSDLIGDIDLSLKVQLAGKKNIWTPFVTVLQEDLTVPAQQMGLRDQADWMLDKWLHLLCKDPAFNRNLSLKHRHFQIETETDATWNNDFHDLPRVYAFPANESGVGEYRVRAPLRALTNAAMIQSSLLPNHSDRLIPDIVEIERIKPDVLLLQNGTADYLIHAWEQYKRFNSVFRIYSQDDLVFALPGKHPLQAKWPKDMRKRLRKLMENSDRLIVANEPLKEAYSRWIDDIKIVPNYLESTRWQNLSTTQKQRSGNKLRVGWAGGAQHHGDLEFIIPVVESLKDEVDWIFMGMCPDRLKPIIKEYHGGVLFDLYPQKLAELDLDLAIAPLEYNNFNTAKTNLRLLEYGVLGWPVVCSDILPYQNAPVTLVGNNTQYWLKAIREKIGEPEALQAEGKVLQQWVLDNYLLEDHLDDWLQALTP